MGCNPFPCTFVSSCLLLTRVILTCLIILGCLSHHTFISFLHCLLISTFKSRLFWVVWFELLAHFCIVYIFDSRVFLALFLAGMLILASFILLYAFALFYQQWAMTLLFSYYFWSNLGIFWKRTQSHSTPLKSMLVRLWCPYLGHLM